MVSPSPKGPQFKKYLLPVFSVQITFPPSGMWGCEGEDEEQIQLKSIYSTSANFYIFKLLDNYFCKEYIRWIVN